MGYTDLRREQYRLENIIDSRLTWLPSVFNAFSIAFAGYSILRAGVRWFGFALPGQCVTNTVINFNFFATGSCGPADPNWLLTRVSFATSAHVWSWVMYGAFALLITFSSRPINGMRGFMLMGFAIAYHEQLWFFTYFLTHPNVSDVLFNLQVYGSFIAFTFIGMGIFVASGYHKDMDWKVFALASIPLLIFYAGWAAIGYPLTLDLKIGVTPLFHDLATNFIEFNSWLLVFPAVGAAFYAKIRH